MTAARSDGIQQSPPPALLVTAEERQRALLTEVAERRLRLMQRLGDGAAVVVPAARERQRNRDCMYPFRQNSDFYYLSAFPEPDAVLLLLPGNSSEVIVFCRPRDPQKELWDGARIGTEGAEAVYGADIAYSVESLDTRMPELLAGRKLVCYPMGEDADFDSRLLGWLKELQAGARGGVQAPLELVSTQAHIHELRVVKSALELTLMREAGAITARAHQQAMKVCKPGLHEYHLEAVLWQQFVQGGARFPAYNHIVGAGANSCTLHYNNNDAEIHDGDLVLIDAGCELCCYAADITRTFPANGRFSPEQRAIYEIVLEAQRQAIAAIRPGANWEQLNQAAVQVLSRGLLDIGLLSGSLEQVLEQRLWQKFQPHRVGHWLGLDVHDVGSYRDAERWRPFEPGMTLTVEPGLYITAKTAEVAPCWHEIGVRIEDNLVVTETGSDFLNGILPREPAEVEQLMATGSD